MKGSFFYVPIDNIKLDHTAVWKYMYRNEQSAYNPVVKFNADKHNK